MIESPFGDGTCSWVMSVNGINKYVTKMTEETQDDHIDDIGKCTGKPVARARPKQTSMTTTSSSLTTLPCYLRVWIDVEPGPYDKSCFEVSKKDDQDLGTDASFRIYILSALVNSSMAELLAKRRGPEKRFQHCVDPLFADTILFLRAIQGHSGEKTHQSYIARQRVVTEPSTSTPLEAPTICTRSFKLV